MRSDRLGPLDPIFDVETQFGAIGAGNTPAVDYVGVTIEQGGTQADPTPFSPIYFDITFTEPVTGFTNGGITLSGTAGATTVILSGASASYTIAVSGMTGTGTVIADVDAGAATSISSGAPNQASTSSDNVVQYNTPTEVVYNYTNGNQSFLVPALVTLIEVEYWGAQGATTGTSVSSPIPGEGGYGGYLLARHTVTPGETLRVMVGGRDDVGNPSSAGFNGGARSASGDLNSQGGGGGGASDVRHSPYALGNRMGVAGGGGGGGGGVANNRPNSNGGAGNGNGAGLDGSNGSTTPAGKGIGATTSAGGAGGSGDGTWAPTNGDPGVVGDGGPGGYYHGGGGGGGLYGGGGGGGGLGPSGGGGGSGGILDGGLLIDDDIGVRASHGLIKIRY